MKRTAYYAHCLSIYDTPQEERDLATIEDPCVEVPLMPGRGLFVRLTRIDLFRTTGGCA